jgi:RhtB (resistance to homoserine/threonine) family protein
MFGIHDFGVFIAACIVLNITPGPDTFYILGRSMAQGRAAGMASVLGIAAGTVVHTLAAALGVSALLAASASAFMVIKFAGAAYLVYLGIRMILTRASAVPIPTSFSSSGFAAIFRQGFLTNLLNPKVALFFLAFVPQFIAPGADNKGLYFVLLGVLFNLNSIPVIVGWAAFAGWMARRSAVQKGMHWLDRAAGVLFIGFGLKLAFTDAPAVGAGH